MDLNRLFAPLLKNARAIQQTDDCISELADIQDFCEDMHLGVAVRQLQDARRQLENTLRILRMQQFFYILGIARAFHLFCRQHGQLALLDPDEWELGVKW